VQGAGELVLSPRKVLAAIQKDASIEVGLPRRQIARIGKRGPAGQAVVGNGRIELAQDLVSPRAKVEDLSVGRIRLDGGVQARKRARGSAGEQAGAPGVAKSLWELGRRTETASQRRTSSGPERFPDIDRLPILPSRGRVIARLKLAAAFDPFLPAGALSAGEI